MGERADGNVVDSGRGNLPNVFQRDTAAGFEFYLAFAQRDGFADFRRLHVVEKNDVDAVDIQKTANLLERVGFDLDLDLRSRFTHFSNCFSKVIKSGDRGQMVVFDQHHVEQT